MKYVKELEIILPEVDTNPSYFGFMFLTNQRLELAKYLEKCNIEFRFLFAGNIVRQPCMQNDKIPNIQIGKFPYTNKIMNEAIWIGVYPGMDREKIDYMCSTIKYFFSDI